jgi:hypothetical protein
VTHWWGSALAFGGLLAVAALVMAPSKSLWSQHARRPGHLLSWSFLVNNLFVAVSTVGAVILLLAGLVGASISWLS